MLGRCCYERSRYDSIRFDFPESRYQQVAAKLLSRGWVKPSYEEALNKREDEFPTGVVSDYISIALPHANPENINKPFVCVVTT